MDLAFIPCPPTLGNVWSIYIYICIYAHNDQVKTFSLWSTTHKLLFTTTLRQMCKSGGGKEPKS